MTAKSETRALPAGPNAREALHQLLSKLLFLPKLEEIIINSSGVELSRAVQDEPVWPPELDGDTDLVGYDFILKRLELHELPVDVCKFPPEALQAAAEGLGNQIVGFLAPQGELAFAYFGLDGTPPRLFGYPVLFGEAETTKLVVVGGPTHFWSDAREGVVIEMEAGL